MRIRIFGVAAAYGVFLAFGCTQKDDVAISDKRDTKSGPYYNFNPTDRDFVRTVAEANIAEADASRLALGKSGSEKVKAFAQHMIEDDHKVSADLVELARMKGVSLPTEADTDHQKDLARLGELKASEFDRAYIGAMVTDHLKAVSLFEDLLNRGRDADVRAYAEKTIPTLRKHLKMAKDLDSMPPESSPNGE